MKIKTNDNRVFTGESAPDIIRAMSSGECSSEQKMLMEIWQMALRIKSYYGKIVDVQSPESFLNSLENIGLITIEEKEKS